MRRRASAARRPWQTDRQINVYTEAPLGAGSDADRRRHGGVAGHGELQRGPDSFHRANEARRVVRREQLLWIETTPRRRRVPWAGKLRLKPSIIGPGFAIPSSRGGRDGMVSYIDAWMGDLLPTVRLSASRTHLRARLRLSSRRRPASRFSEGALSVTVGHPAAAGANVRYPPSADVRQVRSLGRKVERQLSEKRTATSPDASRTVSPASGRCISPRSDERPQDKREPKRTRTHRLCAAASHHLKLRSRSIAGQIPSTGFLSTRYPDDILR